MGPTTQAFGLGKLRELYCELLDRVEGEAPVAAGATPVGEGEKKTPVEVRASPTQEGASRDKASPCEERDKKEKRNADPKRRSKTPEQRERKSKRATSDRRRRRDKKERSSPGKRRRRENAPEEGEKSPEKKEKSAKKKKDHESEEKPKAEEKGRRKTKTPEKRGKEVKEEIDYEDDTGRGVKDLTPESGEEEEEVSRSPSQKERARSSGGRRDRSRSFHPRRQGDLRLRRRSDSRHRSRGGSRKDRSPEVRDRAPKGPRTPSREPPGWRPSSPAGPPPGYFQDPTWQYWNYGRSKGKQRRLRSDDIRKFGANAERKSYRVSAQLLSPGTKIVGEKGVYNGEEVTFAGIIQKVEVEGDSAEVIIKPTGTSSESLLRHVTGAPGCQLRVHLCSEGCDQSRSNPDLIHSKRLRKPTVGKTEAWMDNLIVVDEVPNLREAQQDWLGDAAKKDREESSSSHQKKKKKKKKKKEKKKEEVKKPKIGGRTVAQKPLPSLYGGTGMDPDVGVRKKLLKKVRSRLKKRKESSSSGSSDSSSTSGEGELETDLLQDRSKIQRLAQYGPGVLSAESIRAMKRHIMMSTGQPWEIDQQSLPPVACQYIRQHVMPRASAPMGREVMTLGHIIDLLALGRVAESLDVATQRLKSLELTLQGQGWQTAQKVEVIGSMDAQLATRAEVEAAQRETRLDQKAKVGGTATSSWDKGKGKSKTPGKERDKGGKQEKGKGSGKNDPKKSG
eukprot:Skav224068  [mRNA]  locus=scaffold432:46539:48939:+ [translate_table: standard]